MEETHKHAEEKKNEIHSHTTEHEHKSNEKVAEVKHEHKTHEKGTNVKEDKTTEIKNENKVEAKKEHKENEKKNVKPVVKKDLAVANGYGLHMSKRQGMYICAFIKGKSIDQALADLEQVKLFKKAIPFKGEIPHRKGEGMMSGRYPISAIGLFIPMLKTLKGNITANGMDLIKSRITIASANLAPRPRRRGGEKGKRAHVLLEAREIENKMEKKIKNK